MPKITFPSTGQSYDVDAGTSMLDFCQSHENPVPFGCTTGACGTCACVMVGENGAICEADEDELELLEHTTDKPGARLACQVTISGDVAVTPV